MDMRKKLDKKKVAGEHPHLQELPPAPVPEYLGYRARVRKWSAITVNSSTYSMPSKRRLVESIERIRGAGEARIDYRHIPGSLVRKPGAFVRYRSSNCIRCTTSLEAVD